MFKRFYALGADTGSLFDQCAYYQTREYYKIGGVGEKFQNNPGGFANDNECDEKGWGKFDVRWEVHKNLTKSNARNQD